MATGTVYLDVDDEITSAAARIRGSEATKVALVVPYGSRIATSRMNFRLLSREAVVNNRVLSIVAADPATRALAASAGLPVFANVTEWDTSADPALDTASTDGAPTDDPGTVATAPAAAPASGKRSRKKAAAAAVAASASVSDETQVVAVPVLAPAAVPAPPPAAASARTGPLPSSRPAPEPPRSGAPTTRVSVLRDRSLPRIGAPAAIVAAAGVLALVVAGVGAYVFLPSAEIVVTPRQEGIGPIALVVRADPNVTAPDATTNVVPALQVDVPVEVSESFTTAGRRVEEAPASGSVTFQSYNFLETNTIPAGSIVSTEGGIKFRTAKSITLAEAELVLPNGNVIPSKGSVGVTAVDPGTGGNVPANAIRVVPSGENPDFTTVNNPEPTSGGKHDEFPQVSQADVDAALESLRTKLADAFTAAVDDGAGAPPNATVFAETAVPGEATPDVDPATLVGQEVESFELGLSATGTVIAVDASPVREIAETRLLANVGGDHKLVEGSVDIRQGDPTVVGGVVSFPVTAEAMRVSILDPADLLARIKGRSVDEARTILSEFGQVEITSWPDWVSTIPGIDSRVTIEIVGQTPDPGDGSASPSASTRPGATARPTRTARPTEDASSPATSPAGAGSPAASAAP